MLLRIKSTIKYHLTSIHNPTATAIRYICLTGPIGLFPFLATAGDILIEKLDEFIRRYYKNQLLKGSIYSGALLLGSYITVVLLEYFGEFGSAVRGILFFGFVSASVYVLGRFIVLPLLKLNRIGEIITYEDAAAIIGSHFANVQDKLLNLLQLQNSKMLGGSEELLIAGINQKIVELQPVPFVAAIDLAENKKYLRFLLPVVFLTLLIFFVWPHIIKKGTARLVNYSTYYEKEMPFVFQIQNGELRGLQTEDFNLKVKLIGSEIPEDVFVLVNGVEYKLLKENNIEFSHQFINLQSNFEFQFSAAGFVSKKYLVTVLPKPSLLQFKLQLNYPAYLNKVNEVVSNIGDLQIPEGTLVKWTFNTRNTDQLNLRFTDSIAQPNRRSDNEFVYSRKFFRNNQYAVLALNSFVNSPDSANYDINVIADQFPVIDITEDADSLDQRNIYFNGSIRDDYGFSQLQFVYKLFTTDSAGKKVERQGITPLGFVKGQISQTFYHNLQISQFAMLPGDRLEYFFEVKDNDGVNGAKASRSRIMAFKAPDLEELRQQSNKANSEIKKDLEESIKKTRQLQKDINELSKKINDKKQLAYDDKKKLEDVIKKQQELQNKIDEIKKENEQNNKQQNEFNPSDESIIEKQKQLEQLFENVMTPEMKKLFDELNKMLDKLDKNQVQEKLEELKLSNKDIEKELDRNLEAFKQLEVQQKMQESIDRLDELAKKQDELKNESLNKKEESKEDKNKANEAKPNSEKKDQASDKKADPKELQNKQDELNKQFEDLKKALEDLKEKNQALEEPGKMPDLEKKSEEISKEMQNSSQQLQKNNKKDAAKSQEKASDKMEEMKEEMEQAMQEEEEEKDAENAQALRQILENLLNLSFEQEELIKELPKTRVDNPLYVNFPKQQKKLRDDSKIIEDSLYALSKRVPELGALVNREISAINLNMDKTVRALAERNTGEGTMRMQSTMTSVNNLALLLNENLENMQQQMKAKKESKGQKGGKCKKPGTGTGQKPSPKGSQAATMRQMQQQLNKQLQDLKDALEKGQKPGDKPGDKKGQKQGQGLGQNGNQGANMPGSSEQFAKMAAQQEALRRQMQAMMEKLKNKGQKPGGDLANMMEETEKELVNKQLTNETMRRQQEILSRLLESEKAEREREQDEQRKSNEAKTENFGNPVQFLEYKRLKEKEMELLNTVPPSLTPYYKEKVNQYFNSLNK